MSVVTSVIDNLTVPVGSTTVRRKLTRHANGVVSYERDFLLKGKSHSVTHAVNVTHQTTPTVQGVSVPIWKTRLARINRG